VSDHERSNAAASELASLLGQYRRGEIGRETVLAWLEDDRNVDALGSEARQWFAMEVRKLLAAPAGANVEETRAAIGDLLAGYSRRRSDAHWLE
jgi:hypothetical protein